MCLGAISNSERFCVANKVRGQNHCGTASQAKNKFAPTLDTFYILAGALLGRRGAKKDPFLIHSHIPRGMLLQFETASMSTARWETLFAEAIRKGPPAPAPRQIPSEESILQGGSTKSGNENMDLSVRSDDSKPSLGISLSEVNQVGEGGAPTWVHQIGTTMSVGELAVIIVEQREMIDSLFKMVEGLNNAVPKVVKKLNEVLRPKLQDTTRDVQILQ
jgi:hypothetical protein